MIEKLEKEIIQKLISDYSGKDFVVVPQNPVITSSEDSGGWRYRKLLNITVTSDKWKVKCYCEESGGKVMETDSPICPHCLTEYGAYYRYNDPRDSSKKICLFMPKTKKTVSEKAKKWKDENKGSRCGVQISIAYGDKSSVSSGRHSVGSTCSSREQMLRTYYVREKTDKSNGIDIVRATLSYCTDDNGSINIDEKYDCQTEIVPGRKIVAYKTTKARGREEMSLFDAFKIASENGETEDNIYFEGATSMLDFMHGCEKFAKMTGFMNLLMNYKGRIPENSLFLMYMYLLSEYSVVELLVKMGYYGLVFGLFDEITGSYGRETIKRNVNELSQLLNQTTKGSGALSVPSYIGSYLNAKGASLGEYMTWAAIYELEPLSKEHFDKFIQSEGYLYLNYYDILKKVPNIIKYGYSLNDTCKYVLKQYFEQNKETMNLRSKKRWGRHEIENILYLWKDYLEICEIMGVEAARFPKNLNAVHNDIQAAKSQIENISTDVKLQLIAEQYADFKTESKTLCIVFPKKVYDFVDEGNKQHNCVAHYSGRVANGDCRIFFIRHIDNPDESYITAECTKRGLGQLMYRNNQAVDNYVEKTLATAVCKYILSKPWEPDADELKKRIKQKEGNIGKEIKITQLQSE